MSHFVLARRSQLASATAFAKHWSTSAGLWGASLGAAGLLLLSVTPLVRREVLEKTPVLGLYFQDKTPASDKPF